MVLQRRSSIRWCCCSCTRLDSLLFREGSRWHYRLLARLDKSPCQVEISTCDANEPIYCKSILVPPKLIVEEGNVPLLLLRSLQDLGRVFVPRMKRVVILPLIFISWRSRSRALFSMRQCEEDSSDAFLWINGVGGRKVGSVPLVTLPNVAARERIDFRQYWANIFVNLGRKCVLDKRIISASLLPSIDGNITNYRVQRDWPSCSTTAVASQAVWISLDNRKLGQGKGNRHVSLPKLSLPRWECWDLHHLRRRAIPVVVAVASPSSYVVTRKKRRIVLCRRRPRTRTVHLLSRR